MPELPEVETVRLGLDPVMRGQVMFDVIVRRYDLRGGVPDDFVARVKGARIDDLVRRGKYMVLQLDTGEAIIWHLGMSGRVRIYDDVSLYSEEKHDHVLFMMEGGGCVVFCDPRRFGMMYLEGSDWAVERPFSGMGAEPLGEDFNGGVLYKVLQKRSGFIKNALLDQSMVAGLGNIYVCEALFMAGIAPDRRACDVDEGGCEALALAIQDVLKAALAAGGSSLRDHVQTNGEMGYFQHQFKVYGREGEACVCDDCDAAVERIAQAGRSTFYCSICQV